MSFTAMIERMRAACRASDRPSMKAALALLGNEAVLEVMRNTYKDNAALKVFWRTAADRAVTLLESWDAEAPATDDDRTARLLVHVVARVASLTEAPDLEVRRWAATCSAIGVDEATVRAVASLVSSLVRDNAMARDTTCMSMQWVLAQCTKRGYPVVPFDG